MTTAVSQIFHKLFLLLLSCYTAFHLENFSFFFKKVLWSFFHVLTFRLVMWFLMRIHYSDPTLTTVIQVLTKSEPLVYHSYRVVQSRPESLGVICSHPESSGVARSRPESFGDKVDGLHVRRIPDDSGRLRFWTIPTPNDSGRFRTTPDDSGWLRRRAISDNFGQFRQLMLDGPIVGSRRFINYRSRIGVDTRLFYLTLFENNSLLPIL